MFSCRTRFVHGYVVRSDRSRISQIVNKQRKKNIFNNVKGEEINPLGPLVIVDGRWYSSLGHRTSSPRTPCHHQYLDDIHVHIYNIRVLSDSLRKKMPNIHFVYGSEEALKLMSTCFFFFSVNKLRIYSNSVSFSTSSHFAPFQSLSPFYIALLYQKSISIVLAAVSITWLMFVDRRFPSDSIESLDDNTSNIIKMKNVEKIDFNLNGFERSHWWGTISVDPTESTTKSNPNGYDDDDD